jgi:ribosomal protein S18 acetylase RimI-like enzyme
VTVGHRRYAQAVTPEIVQASVDDWEVVRDIRLRALADSPSAFASSLDEERDRPAEFWGARLAAADASTFLALEAGTAVGLVTVFRTSEHPSRASLVSMWVAPERRGRRLGRALVERVVTWAGARGAKTVELWVTDSNEAARALYEATGFRPTGERQPLPSDPALLESRMTRPVEEPGG